MIDKNQKFAKTSDIRVSRKTAPRTLLTFAQRSKNIQAPKKVISQPKPEIFFQPVILQSEEAPAPVVKDVKFAGDNINFVSTPSLAAFKFKDVSAFVLLAITIFFAFQGAHIIASGISTKATVQGTTSEALSHLKDAQSLIQQKDFLAAEQQFEYAQQNFADAQKNISNLGLAVNAILKLTPQGSSANQLLKAGQELSQAGIDFDNFYVLTNQIKISPSGFETPDGFYSTINAAKKYLEDASANLTSAQSDLSAVDSSTLPANYKDSFFKYKEQLDFAANASVQLSQLLNLFQQFMGPGQKTILVVFENNNELRPTGGFIGTYGLFKLDNGKITNQKISSVYDIDGQIKEKIAPPGPFHDATQTWGLRDSNWFVDFKQSAQKITGFYEKEAGETPDAVVAVTPDLFVDLLKITGPVNFPQYNLVLNSDNFRDQVQLNTSVLYDKKQNIPKQMLADLAPLMLQKLSDIPEGSKTELLSALFKNLFEKNILFYDRNEDIQQGFENYNWAGLINSNDSDYLAIYNANIGGRKTDLDVKQSATILSEVQPDGKIVNTVSYTRAHQINLNNPDKNIDYVRFLVPQGSKLISATGFTKKPIYPSDGSANPLGSSDKVDADLMALDKNSTVDPTSGVVTGVESGKTTFASWIDVNPGEQQTVVLKYSLPMNYNSAKHFSILFQKQPGNNPININYSLVQTKKITWYTPSNLDLNNRLNPGTISYRGDLLQDTFLGAVFEDK